MCPCLKLLSVQQWASSILHPTPISVFCQIMYFAPLCLPTNYVLMSNTKDTIPTKPHIHLRDEQKMLINVKRFQRDEDRHLYPEWRQNVWANLTFKRNDIIATTSHFETFLSVKKTDFHPVNNWQFWVNIKQRGWVSSGTSSLELLGSKQQK